MNAKDVLAIVERFHSEADLVVLAVRKVVAERSISNTALRLALVELVARLIVDGPVPLEKVQRELQAAITAMRMDHEANAFLAEALKRFSNAGEA